jgi:hypothetical protein
MMTLGFGGRTDDGTDGFALITATRSYEWRWWGVLLGFQMQ